MKELKYLNKYLYKYRGRLLIGMFITIGARLFSLFPPQLIGKSTAVIEQYINGETVSKAELKSELMLNIALILGAAIASAVLTFLMRQTFIVASRFIEYDLKNEIFQQYENLSLNFYKKNRTGDLMNRISDDVSKSRLYIGPAIMYSVTTLTLFIVLITYMFIKAPTLTLYTLLPFPILSFAIYKLSVAINQKSNVVQEFLSKLNTFTQEAFSGISVIKSYGMMASMNNNFIDLSNESKTKNLDLVRVQALFFPMMILLIGASNIIVIYVGSLQYFNGEIANIGVIVEFIIYVNMLTWPVASVGFITTMVQRAEASQKRINEFLKQEPQIQNSKESISKTIDGDITFKNVSFTYEDTNITALKNVSFEVKSGQRLVILGNTGSGKSTILELIGRLYDASEGTVFMDNVPIEKLDLNTLRKSIGYVPQDAFLFSESIKENIKFGKADATDEEIYEAAKSAEVHENIINFKNGYNTILGERGITLSGGQKQRVSIARAIIKKPDVILFDDCLSAVDTETEEAIMQKFNSISKNKTAIIVSHRISSAKHADEIIVLEKGEIIQQGNHEKLVNQEGYYKSLYEKQLKSKEN